jgi:hypothetical protein
VGEINMHRSTVRVVFLLVETNETAGKSLTSAVSCGSLRTVGNQ